MALPHPIFEFVCSPGYRASLRYVIAECTITQTERPDPVILHLTRNNGASEWQVTDPDQNPPSKSVEQVLMELLLSYSERENQTYRPR